MFLTKTKIDGALLLVVGLFAIGTGVFPCRSLAAKGQETTPAQSAQPASETKPGPRKAADAADKASVTFSGQVLDPDGKPVAGARLYLLSYTPKVLPIPVRATSDTEGHFRFTVARKDFDQSASTRPWDEAITVATAAGYGLGLPTVQVGKRLTPTDLTLHLPKDDVPITGRILDLQGKPIAGVTVGVHGLYWSARGDLAAWLRDLKEKKEAYPALRAHLIGLEGGWMGRDIAKVCPPVMTGADGRFRLTGIGRERVVALRLEGASIVTTELFAMTRPGGTIRAAQWRRGDFGDEVTFHGSAFEHVAAPCRPIVGVVRDKDTGKPIPGAVVQNYMSRGSYVGYPYPRTVADKEGRYRLTGMSRGEGTMIRAAGPDGQPYLMSVARVPAGFALEPVTVDFQLKRGVWVHGRVTDKATGEPVHSMIQCAVFDDNPFRKEVPGLTFPEHMQTRAADGSFRFVTLPGRSVIAARAWQQRYLTDVGRDRIKGLDRLSLVTPFHTVVEINPAGDAASVKCDIVLDPGRTLAGTVLGPDRRPLSGAVPGGLSGTGDWEYQPLPTAAFTVLALKPGETRRLQFSHAEKHLAGSLVVRGDAKGPLTVQLGPAATLTGRFVLPDGKPLADLELFSLLEEPVASPASRAKEPDPTVGTFPRGLRTDKGGKFRIENLAPGLKYRLSLFKGTYLLVPDGPAGKGVTLKAGETKDLGDVIINPVE